MRYLPTKPLKRFPSGFKRGRARSPSGCPSHRALDDAAHPGPVWEGAVRLGLPSKARARVT